METAKFVHLARIATQTLNSEVKKLREKKNHVQNVTRRLSGRFKTKEKKKLAESDQKG